MPKTKPFAQLSDDLEKALRHAAGIGFALQFCMSSGHGLEADATYADAMEAINDLLRNARTAAQAIEEIRQAQVEDEARQPVTPGAK